MNWIWHMCLANMKERGIRTLLTILGVVMGVVSIVCLLALGIGVKEEILSDVEAAGVVTQITVTGNQESRWKSQMLTDRKLSGIEKIEHVKGVYPVLSVPVVMKWNHYICYGQLQGIPREYLVEMELGAGVLPKDSGRKPELILGRNMLDLFYSEISGASYVEKYLEETEDSYSGNIPFEKEDGSKNWNNLTGELFEVSLDMEEDKKSSKLEVVAMTARPSYDMYCDMGVMKAYLKQNSMEGKITGQPLDKNGMPYKEWIYQNAIVCVDDVENVDRVVKRLQEMGLQAQSEKEYVDSVKKEVKMLQVLLGGIGMIALVVAVIGIGNTMTTSVYDRIGDIGILKVLGCDSGELMKLFLLESAILGGIGGLLGLFASYGIVAGGVNRLAVRLMNLPKETRLAVVPWWLSLGSVCFSILLGMIAGYFPAKWAAKLKPIQAIRKNRQ